VDFTDEHFERGLQETHKKRVGAKKEIAKLLGHVGGFVRSDRHMRPVGKQETRTGGVRMGGRHLSPGGSKRTI